MLKSIDLFCGAGLMRLAFEPFFRTVFACDIDKFARKTYAANFGDDPAGDITKIHSDDIPYGDVVVGGFPCQTWSTLGKKAGFSDPRGLLYREVLRIVGEKKPRAFFLENVVGIKKALPQIAEDFQAIGYSFAWKEIPASLVWPQKRTRVYMVGLRDGEPFVFPQIEQRDVNVWDLLDDPPKPEDLRLASQACWDRVRRKKAEGAQGSWAYQWIDRSVRICPTITCDWSGSRILLPLEGSDLPRRLTLRELARIQGLPDSFTFPVSPCQTEKQIGNGVCVPVVRILAEALAERLNA